MIGNRLRELRERRDVKQTQISAYLEIGQNTYSRWENNERRPDYEKLIMIADFYNVSVDYLLGHKVKEKSKLQKLDEILSEEQKEKLISICETFYPDECKKIDQ